MQAEEVSRNKTFQQNEATDGAHQQAWPLGSLRGKFLKSSRRCS